LVRPLEAQCLRDTGCRRVVLLRLQLIHKIQTDTRHRHRELFPLRRPIHATLRQLGSKLKQGSEHITIIGSTSSEGGDTVNDPLSRQRAGAVAGILTSMGIPSSRMTTVGDGSHWPGRVNDTGPGGVLLPAQAEQNRVVVVQLPKCT